MVAVSVWPTCAVPSILTAVMVSVTVTVHLAVFAPSPVSTVISAVPAALAVTVPSAVTSATLFLLLSHVTVLFVALSGCTVATSFSVPPFASVVVFLFRVTPVTGVISFPVYHTAQPQPCRRLPLRRIRADPSQHRQSLFPFCRLRCSQSALQKW